MTDQNEPDLEAARRILEERRAELRDFARTASEASRPVELDQSRVGRLSRMDALQAQAMSIDGERRRRLELQRIEAALVRVEAGEYGYCLVCGERIAEGRLAVDPAAPRCVGCAEG